MSYFTIDQIKRANHEAGQHWFEPYTLRFFKSRIHPTVYPGAHFVTSERGPDERRLYSVRRATPDGSIETADKFQAFRTSRAAHNAAKRAGKEALAS